MSIDAARFGDIASYIHVLWSGKSTLDTVLNIN